MGRTYCGREVPHGRLSVFLLQKTYRKIHRNDTFPGDFYCIVDWDVSLCVHCYTAYEHTHLDLKIAIQLVNDIHTLFDLKLLYSLE